MPKWEMCFSNIGYPMQKAIGIRHLRGRKRLCLYYREGAAIQPIASFSNDESADIFQKAIEELAQAIATQERMKYEWQDLNTETKK